MIPDNIQINQYKISNSSYFRVIFVKNIVKALKKIVGKNNVLTDELILALYSKNAIGSSGKALCVVFPENSTHISEIVRLCYKENIKIYPQGSATELSGSSTPHDGIVMSFSKMNKIEEINIVDGYVCVQPGVRIHELNDVLSEYGYMFPVDPASGKSATIGGAINTGAGGLRGARYGTMTDWVLGLEVVIPDENGTLLKLGNNTLKCRQGYDLVRLIVGSEGTLAIVTRAFLKITPAPENIVVVTSFFNSPEDAMKAIGEIKKRRMLPAMMEFIDEDVVRMGKEIIDVKTEGEGHMLIVGQECPPELAEKCAEKLVNIMKGADATYIDFALSESEAENKGLINLRRAFYPLAINLGSKEFGESITLVLIEDFVVPVSKLPEAVRIVKEAGKKYGFMVLTGGHVGDGNLHPMIWTDVENKEMMEKAEKFYLEIMERIIEIGGSISAEHGIGEMKREGLKLELRKRGSEKALDIMKQIKEVWDPKSILNPNKVV